MSRNLYLGHRYIERKPSNERMQIDTEDLLTHVFICGATGSGKTVLGKIIIEEAAMAGIPSILIDLKGDLSSLAIPFAKLDRHDIEPWIEARSAEERNEKAVQALKNYKANMVRSELQVSDLSRFRQGVDVRIYTPRSLMGIPLSLSPLAVSSKGVQHLSSTDRESFLHLVGTVTDAILERCYLDHEREGMLEERTFLEEIVAHLWQKGVPLEGRKGIAALIRAVITPPLEHVGVMKPNDFLSEEKRHAIARRLNRMLAGAESLWYEGEPMQSVLDSLTRNDGRTPILIINLSHLDTFEDRNLVVSHVAYSIYSWMRRKIEWAGPRLLFYIDEIGGGGKHAFYPDDPHVNASKSAINLLLRQGRAFGVCSVLSTQNPGDIDYRGLTNCQTWFIGKLLTEQDRSKIIRGLMSVNFMIKNFEEFIKSADPGDFAVKLRGGDLHHFRERWLLTWHKVVTVEDFPLLNQSLRHAGVITEAWHKLETGGAAQALDWLDQQIKELKADGNLLIARGGLLEALNRPQDAMNEYCNALKLRSTDDALLRLGRLQVKDGKPGDALESFRQGVALNPQNEYLHLEMGQIYQLLDMIEPADESFQLAIKSNVNLAEAWIARGWFQLEQGNLVEAHRCFERAQTLTPEDPVPGTGLAVAEHRLGQTVAALQTLGKLLEVHPGNSKILYQKSRIHLELEEMDDALLCSEAMLKHDRENPLAWRNHGEILIAADRWQDGVKVLHHGTQVAAGDWRIWDLLSQALTGAGKATDAVAAARRAVELNGGRAEIRYHLALAQRSAGDVKAERQTLEELASLHPEFLPAWLDISIHLEAEDKLAEAVQRIEDAIVRTRGREELILRKAELLLKQKEFTIIAPLLDTLQNLKTTDFRVPLYKAQALKALSVDDPARAMDALATLKDGCVVFPESIALWLERARMLLEEKRFRDAAECIDRAMRIDDQNPEIWDVRGDVQKAMFEEDAAEKCYARARTLRGEGDQQ